MKITVSRFEFSSISTISKVYIDDVFHCYGLEDAYREILGQPPSVWKKQDITAIPEGTYEITINLSNHFKKMMIEILNVPGWQGVRIHKGNRPKETEGCLLVGKHKSIDLVYDCKDVYNDLFNKVQTALNNKEKVFITYQGRPNFLGGKVNG